MENDNLKDMSAISDSNLNCIETDLWLGNLAAALNMELLREKKLKYILTINSFPLTEKIINLSSVVTKYIQVTDDCENDLLTYFNETYKFIETSLKKGGVLVHCYHGISRSATIVISYIMKKKKMTMEEALKYVKSKRKFIEPNSGFLKQLKLFEIMKWTLDENNLQYKIYKLQMASNNKKKGHDVCVCANVNVDLLLSTVNVDTMVFKCKKCRTILASSLNEIPHAPNGICSWTDNKLSRNLKETEVCLKSYFIEPLTWMENVNVFLEGKLQCPNKACGNKLGSFNWITGFQCPCGTKVCPGFYLIPSKVDKQHVNVKCRTSFPINALYF